MKRFFPILSLFLLSFLAILNFVDISREVRPNRSFLLSLVIWFSIVTLAQFVYILHMSIKRLSFKMSINLFYTIILLVSYGLSLIFILVEYCCYQVWYATSLETDIWNKGLTYSLNCLVLMIFCLNIGWITHSFVREHLKKDETTDELSGK